MKKNKFVEGIYQNGICCSCGVCKGICLQEAISYKVDKMGYFKPMIDGTKCTKCGLCEKYCPGGQYYKVTPVEVPKNDKYYLAYSCDEQIRYGAASGGLTTELLCYLIESGKVDYCTVVDNIVSIDKIEAHVTNDVDVIRDGKTSKYMPIDMGEIIRKVRDENKRVAIVGVPCQIQALKKMFGQKRELIYIALFCNHCSSVNATKFLLNGMKIRKTDYVLHRGEGWPGYFKIADAKTQKAYRIPFRKVYINSFGWYFNNMRCRMCNDPFGDFADISVGDAFVTSETNETGKTLCFVRNEKINQILHEMVIEDRIVMEEFNDTEAIKEAFPGQMKREITAVKTLQAIKESYLFKKKIGEPRNAEKLNNGLASQLSSVEKKLIYKDILRYRIVGSFRLLWGYIYKKKGIQNDVEEIR